MNDRNPITVTEVAGDLFYALGDEPIKYGDVMYTTQGDDDIEAAGVMTLTATREDGTQARFRVTVAAL